MNTTLTTAILSALLAAGTVLAADPPQAAVAPAASEKPAAEDKRVPSNCLRETGSLIRPRSSEDCLNVPGRSYGRDSLDSTGAVDTGDALSKLDPSVTIHR
jgi:hypothetical protein